MGSDFLLFFTILLVFFGLWLYGGGPTKPISFAGPYITPVTNVGITQNGYGSLNTSFSSNTHITSPADIDRTITDAYDSIGELQQKVNDLRLYGIASPFKDTVTIESVDSTGDIRDESVTIRASYDNEQNVTISGWKLVSVSTGHSYTIPSGTELPQSGRVNQTAPIVLHPGDTATISSIDSPIGVSFLENECTGYLNQYQHFDDSLPNQCPDALDEYDRHYSGNKYNDGGCYELMQDTPTCVTPKDTRRMTSACFSIVDTYLNYNGCVANHRYEPDFRGDTWHIYLNRDTDDDPLWKDSREAVRLVDQNGQTVDLYEY